MSDYYGDALAKENQMMAQAGTLSPSVRNRELIPNLKGQRAELVARIQSIDTLLQLLEKNPDFVKMLDLTRELI